MSEKTTTVPPKRNLVFAEAVQGADPPAWLVTLECGHKLATRKQQVGYECRECEPVIAQNDGAAKHATHTPGPWKVVRPGHRHSTQYQYVQIGASGLYTTSELWPADARLIAAAPELLAALMQIVYWSDQDSGIDPGHWIIAKEVIRKALGDDSP